MKVVESGLGGVLVFEPVVYGDQRGFFFESYREDLFRQSSGTSRPFVQDNHSRSVRHVLRGLHYQVRQPQGKLIRAVVGDSIAWPLTADPILAAKDVSGRRLAECEVIETR